MAESEELAVLRARRAAVAAGIPRVDARQGHFHAERVRIQLRRTFYALTALEVRTADRLGL